MTLFIVAGLVWLIGGYFFARWFINHVLDNGCWADTGRPANPLLVHFVSPIMAPLMALFVLGDGLVRLIKWVGNKTGNRFWLRRFYGVDK